MNATNSELAVSNTVAQLVMDTLRVRITDGVIPPGAPIPQEAIASELGVSRIPVRDALSRLGAEGLVVILPNKVARARLLDYRDLNETYEIRQALEELAIAKSAANVTPKHLAEIRSARLDAERVRGDARASLTEDERFHLACYSAAESPQLLGMVERLWRVSRVYRMAYWPHLTEEQKDRAFSDHLAIEQSLRAGRVGVARELVKAHLQNTKDRLAADSHLFPDPIDHADIERSPANG